jgi:hypothetical protein
MVKLRVLVQKLRDMNLINRGTFLGHEGIDPQIGKE